ncbi:MAG: hypothetical protein HGB10_02200 [Coriobacteriia bacterium]|nr:hypothetical protein [Coriobacteriia bacterium]
MRTRTMRIAACVLAVAVAISLAGCSSGAKDGAPANLGDAVGTAKDNASIATCRTNRATLGQLLSTSASTAEGTPPTLAQLVAENKVICPSGGAYSLNAATGKVACSVHGE